MIPGWVTYFLNKKTQNYLRTDHTERKESYSQIRINRINGIDYLEGCYKRKWNTIGRLQGFNRYRCWFTVRACINGSLTLVLIRRRKREKRLDLFLFPNEIILNKERKAKLKQFVTSWKGYSIE